MNAFVDRVHIIAQFETQFERLHQILISRVDQAGQPAYSRSGHQRRRLVYRCDHRIGAVGQRWLLGNARVGVLCQLQSRRMKGALRDWPLEAFRNTHPLTERRIAPVMSAAGADWLERPEREMEERPEEALDAIVIELGMTIADIGAAPGLISRCVWRGESARQA